MADIPPIFSFTTQSDKETEACGARFATYLSKNEKNGAFVAMYGDLGAGKTAFVRGAASVISPSSYVQSPTYTVVNEYQGTSHCLFHFDMYRIDDEDSLDSIGFWDYLRRGGYSFCEWSEKIPFALPDVYYRLKIKKDACDEAVRYITITKVG